MKYTVENLSEGLTPEYKSACKSLEMYMRKNFGERNYWLGKDEFELRYWFMPPHLEGCVRGPSLSASTKLNGTFGVMFHYYKESMEDYCKLFIEAKIPCDKLAWKVRKVED